MKENKMGGTSLYLVQFLIKEKKWVMLTKSLEMDWLLPTCLALHRPTSPLFANLDQNEASNNSTIITNKHLSKLHKYTTFKPNTEHTNSSCMYVTFIDQANISRVSTFCVFFICLTFFTTFNNLSLCRELPLDLPHCWARLRVGKCENPRS